MKELTRVLKQYLGNQIINNDTTTNDKNEEKKKKYEMMNNYNHHHPSTTIPTGDEFMNAIGSLCGAHPSGHWIDIVGITDRMISHSWHQDTGRLHAGLGLDRENEFTIKEKGWGGDDNEKYTYTVMMGFPKEDNYQGTGVFSHVLQLNRTHYAPPKGHGYNEPVLFEGTVEETYIVRPSFGLGRELIRYRDVDVLHSAPDVAYRESVMRFM